MVFRLFINLCVSAVIAYIVLAGFAVKESRNEDVIQVDDGLALVTAGISVILWYLVSVENDHELVSHRAVALLSLQSSSLNLFTHFKLIF